MSQPEQFFKNPGSSHRSSPIAMAICVRSRCGEMNIPMGPMGPINQITSCHITFIGSFVGPGGFFSNGLGTVPDYTSFIIDGNW